ncbi:MAG: hypothetical protein IIY02_00515, partial [Firmicutes bacterium]|nr:hypothetical protein [Bacillota bacterium]
VARIRALLDGSHMIRSGDSLRPIRPEDIVILLRAPGSVGGMYARALEQAGIRCSFGGSVNIAFCPMTCDIRESIRGGERGGKYQK